LVVSWDISKDHREDDFFKLSPDGKLQLAVMGVSRWKNGLPVKESGRVHKASGDDPAIRKEFKRELEILAERKIPRHPGEDAPAPKPK